MRGVRFALRTIHLESVLVVALFALAAACSPKPAAPKVLFIGVDGATWDLANEWVDGGELPNLKALIERGYSAQLDTFQPSLSPIIWTSIASGKTKEKHGITGFVHTALDGKVEGPVLSNERKVRAIWDILGERDITVGVVGWWLTWPAEIVNGFMVSSLSVSQAGMWKGSAYVGLPRQTHPPSLSPELDRVVLAEQARSTELARDLFGDLPANWGNAVQQRVIADTKCALLSDQVFFESAKAFRERDPVSFCAVYCGIVDVAGHRMWKYFKPRGGSWRVSSDEQEKLGRVIPNAYKWVDRKIGELVSAAGPDTIVMIASDHGFHAEMRPDMSDDERSGGHEFALLPGIFVVAGPGIRHADLRRDEKAPRSSVYDIAPTLLYLYGQPVAKDMDGAIARQIFTPEFLAAHPEAPKIETYETTPRPTVAVSTEESAAAGKAKDDMVDRLRSLGYLGAENSATKNDDATKQK